jgi:hypothetical protein
MKFSKLSLFAALATILALLASGPRILAMEGGNSSDPVDGPELWGVAVINCNSQYATIRVKKIVDCNVEKQAEALMPFALCPADESEVLYQKLTGATLFSDPRTPIITKVKNFECKVSTTDPPVNVCSFDAQIKFLVPPPSQ